VIGAALQTVRAWIEPESPSTADRLDEPTTQQREEVQCRDYGRWHTQQHATCPHCDSGNTVTKGPPAPRN